MTWFALGISILAVAMTFFFRSKNKEVVRALEASQENEAELTQTLAEILDSDGTIRGQLMLPGKMSTDDAVVRLAEAEKAMTEVLERLNKERANKKDIETLVEAVNGDSVVQIRLPGKAVTPNNTPCGQMCKHAFFVKSERWEIGNGFSGEWDCKAGQGRKCDEVRDQFLDANNQCVMFVTKELGDKS